MSAKIPRISGVKAPPTFRRNGSPRKPKAVVNPAASPVAYIPQPTARELAWYKLRDEAAKAAKEETTV